MMSHPAIRAVLFLCLSALGCASDAREPAATCETVTDHLMGLTAEEHTRQRRDPMTAETAARRRQQAIERCEARGVAPAQLACLLAASDRAAVETCETVAAR